MSAAENHIFGWIQVGEPINLATKGELCSSDYVNIYLFLLQMSESVEPKSHHLVENNVQAEYFLPPDECDHIIPAPSGVTAHSLKAEPGVSQLRED